jgi:hypothetical protein
LVILIEKEFLKELFTLKELEQLGILKSLMMSLNTVEQVSYKKLENVHQFLLDFQLLVVKKVLLILKEIQEVLL